MDRRRARSGSETGPPRSCPGPPSTIECEAPPRIAAQSEPLHVEASGGSASDEIDVAWSAATITKVVPSQGPIAGGMVLRIQGSNFSRTSAPLIDGAPPVLLHAGPGQLVVLSPPGGSGVAQVTVTDFGKSSNAMSYTRLDPPVITSVTPVQGPLAGGTALTLYGQNFATDGNVAMWVRLGDLSCLPATPVSSTECAITTGPSPSAGPVDVTVSVDGASATLPDGFAYTNTTGVESGPLPPALALAIGPNPFAGSTWLALALPEPTAWRLTVHDVRGALVQRFEGRSEAGLVTQIGMAELQPAPAPTPASTSVRLEAAGRRLRHRLVKLD